MTHYERRHSRWYEIALFSTSFQVIAGVFVVALIPATLLWGNWWYWGNSGQINAVLTGTICFAISIISLRHMQRVTIAQDMAHIAPVVIITFFAAFMLLLFTRSAYARSLMLIAFALTLLWCYAAFFLGRRFRRRKFAVVPATTTSGLSSTDTMEIRYLSEPDLQGVRYDGIVADLRDTELSAEWERFLAECILAQIPVYQVERVREAMTGRVQLDHLSENATGALLPSPLYVATKRTMDVIGMLILIPLLSPVMLITAIAIRRDSPGPAIFKQTRVGYGNRDFNVYKFRSMRVDSEKSGAQFASSNDDRITRLGHFIRKTRLDELPQLWNVLKGDMSLIGPRPEQRAFVEQFEEEIPFYTYRHVIRPGVTGWAQVMQGYAADTDDTRIKIQFDFFYIKHFSFWLDLLVTLKTIRVLFTGWGAR